VGEKNSLSGRNSLSPGEAPRIGLGKTKGDGLFRLKGKGKKENSGETSFQKKIKTAQKNHNRWLLAKKQNRFGEINWGDCFWGRRVKSKWGRGDIMGGTQKITPP